MKRLLMSVRRRLETALGSLRLRMTVAGIALLAAVVALTTIVLVRQANESILFEQRDRELEETARTAAVLASRVLEMQEMLRSVGEQMDERLLHDGTALARFMEDRVVLRRMFGNVTVFTPDGQSRVHADRDGVRAVQFNIADRSDFRQTVDTGAPVISEALQGRAVAQPVIMLTQPLHGAHDVYGVLGGAVLLGSGDLMSQVLQYRDVEAPDVLRVITDEQGRILAHPDAARMLQPLASEPRLARAWGAWQAMGRPMESTGVAPAQEGEVVTVAAVAGPQWLVWRALPEAQLLAPVHAAQAHATRWAVVLLVAASVALLALVSWLLRPVRALQLRAQQLFNPRVNPQEGWPKASGEIGRLAHALRQASMEHVLMQDVNSDLLQRLESVMAAAPVGIAFTRNDHLELVNEELCRLLGRPAAQLARAPLQRMGPDEATATVLLRHVHRKLRRQHSYRGEWKIKRADGSGFWAAVRVRSAQPGDPERGLIWTVSDISAQVAARAELQHVASHDPLTGLANRALALEQLGLLMAAAQRQGRHVALCYLDLDGFKAINDQLGHAQGDALLVAAAERLRHAVREGDTAARLGGDEFVLLLGAISGPAAVQPVVDRVLQLLAQPFALAGQAQRVTASIGVAMYPEHGSTPEHLLRAADQAMYHAKRLGKNRACLADEDALGIPVRDVLLDELSRALVGGELCLHYQPKVCARTRRCLGVEALVRWQHPQRGLLAPGVFIPAVIGTPLEVALDRWVLREAVAQLAQWRATGRGLSVAVNVSPATLALPDLAQVVAAVVREAAPRHIFQLEGLELKVVETAALADLDATSRAIETCARQGVSFALDDFGTGYSSLSYLQRLPVNTLKIDRSFVAHMLSEAGDLHIVRAVIGLAQAFAIATVAEGVETEEQARALAELGCHMLQGYGIARPMPVAALEAWLDTHAREQTVPTAPVGMR